MNNTHKNAKRDGDNLSALVELGYVGKLGRLFRE